MEKEKAKDQTKDAITPERLQTEVQALQQLLLAMVIDKSEEKICPDQHIDGFLMRKLKVNQSEEQLEYI